MLHLKQVPRERQTSPQKELLITRILACKRARKRVNLFHCSTDITHKRKDGIYYYQRQLQVS